MRRLGGDPARAAYTDEVKDLRGHTGAPKECVVYLTLQNLLLNKARVGWRRLRMRYSASESWSPSGSLSFHTCADAAASGEPAISLASASASALRRFGGCRHSRSEASLNKARKFSARLSCRCSHTPCRQGRSYADEPVEQRERGWRIVRLPHRQAGPHRETVPIDDGGHFGRKSTPGATDRPAYFLAAWWQ